VDIRIDSSWPIIAVLITFSLWSRFSEPSLLPTTPEGLIAVLSLATSLLFFLSVLAHELAHAGAARLRGIPVEGITLIFFGGATHARLESRGPIDEFLVTAAGPATSLATGGVFWLARVGVERISSPELYVMFGYLAGINIILGLFNLAPGFPLDGGRLLRSAVWRFTGSMETGTKVAARGGQALGAVLAGIGLVLLVTEGSIGYAWFAFLGWFLFRAASETLVDSERKRLMATTVARDVMSPPPPTIPSDLPLGEAVERHLEDHDGEAFPVTENGRVIGFVSMRSADGKPVDAPVREALTELEGVIEAGPEDPLDQVTGRLQDARGQAVLIMEDGQLVGVIEPDDLNRYFRRLATSPRRRG
jgi:Zn-dependent protease/predicted transcriptional regulator